MALATGRQSSSGTPSTAWKTGRPKTTRWLGHASRHPDRPCGHQCLDFRVCVIHASIRNRRPASGAPPRCAPVYGLARPDVYPDGDLGMRKVIRDHDGLPVLPVFAPVRPASRDARPNPLDFLLHAPALVKRLYIRSIQRPIPVFPTPASARTTASICPLATRAVCSDWPSTSSVVRSAWPAWSA